MLIELKIVGKELLSSTGRKAKSVLVSDNDDYIIKIINDDLPFGTFARFEANGEKQDIALDSENCVCIPKWILENECFNMGVYTASIASTPFVFTVIDSILKRNGINREDVEQSVIEQLMQLVNSIDVSAAVNEYLTEHPIEYELPKATSDILGGIKVGENLKIDENGVLSVDTANDADADNTKPITAAAVQVQLGNINALLSTI